MTDVIGRITRLMQEREWTAYKLSKETGLSSSTIANMFRRNTIPSIATLETICDALGITLAQFFSEDMDQVSLTVEQKELFDKWSNLTVTQKKIIDNIIREFK